MKYLIAIISILFRLHGFSKITPPLIDLDKIFNELKIYNDSSIIRDFKGDFFKNLRFKNDSIAYFNPNGTLHLFEINFDTTLTVRKLSKGIYHGITFNRYFFKNGNKLYSIGGEGFWTTFPKLLEFNFKNKEWFEIEIEDYPIDTRKVVSSWLLGDKLKVLLTRGDSKGSKKHNFVYGEIDMNTFRFKETGRFKSMNSTELSFGNGNAISESNKYIVFENSRLNNCFYGVFDKNNGEILYMNLLKDIPCIDGASFVYLNDSILYYRNSSLVLDSVVINKSSYYQKAAIQDIYLKNISQEKIYTISSYSIGFTVLSILIILLVKKINLSSNSSDENTFEIEKKLLINKGSIVKREELDELLGIAHLSFDSIKSKRSSMIRTINLNGRLKIERIRKEDDKRFFKYSIN